MDNKLPIDRCGYCGRYFQGDTYLITEDLVLLEKEGRLSEIENAPLGYCPEAGYEHAQLNPEQDSNLY